MPLFTGKTEPGADMFRLCPNCGEDQIYSESEGFRQETTYLCDACEKEAEKSEVKKSFSELVDEIRKDTGTSNSEGPDTPKIAVCRECREEVSERVNRCPHCGWKPKKRGGLWWGTTAVMSLNPIGWAMGAKGASDAQKASKGVWEKVVVDEFEQDTSPDEVASEEDPIEAIERLKELADQEIISESEFEEKKSELLDQI